MILFRDFAPKQLRPAGFLKAAEYQELHEALADANRWVEENAIEVVNVETVVLPSLHDPMEEGTTDPELHVSGKMSTTWHQFIRVWFQST